MKPFKIKKETGGEHFKIFIRNKLPKPKAPLMLFKRVHEPSKMSVIFEFDITE
jgi:hypothetical protein